MQLNGTTLKEALKTKSIKQCEFASLAEVSPSAASQILNGRQKLGPRLEGKVLRALRLLEFTPVELQSIGASGLFDDVANL